LIITVVVGMIGFSNITSNIATTEALVSRNADFLSNVQTLKIEALQHRRYEKDFFLNIGKPEKQSKYVKRFESVSGSVRDRLEYLAGVIENELHLPKEVGATLSDAKTAYINYHDSFIKLTQVVLGDAGMTPQQANKLMGPFKDQIYTFEKGVNALLEVAVDAMQSKANEAVVSGNRMKKWMLGVVIAGAAIIILIAHFTVRRIRSGLRMLADQMQDVANGEGDLTKRIDINSKDEISEVAGWFNAFLGKLQGIMKEIAGGVETLSSSSTELSAISEQMTQGIKNVSDKSTTVSAATEEMSANMNNVAAAMEQSATNTNMVATAAEEMSATIGEIARNAEKARSISGEASHKAASTSTNMDQLGNAANSIGKVVETITEISEQVNLLALNATIEAARAGEAGKGFAVVANEIKELAKQTAEASGDIKEKIDGIQGTTATTVTQISEITQVITHVNEVVATIATAVEQQSAATKEIADNVAQASTGIQEVNENVNQGSAVSGEISQDIAGVSTSMDEMSTSSSQVNLSAQELSQLSENLKQMVDQFKI
jgi:methyl-accepting chemotaxis protein